MDKNQPTSQDTPLFEAFFEQTSQPYCVVKADGSLLKANAAFLNHFGWNKCEERVIFYTIYCIHSIR